MSPSSSGKSDPNIDVSNELAHYNTSNVLLQVGFNVELGGYFSIKRNATSIPGDTWLDIEEVAPYCKAILEVFRYCCTLSCALYCCDFQFVEVGQHRFDFVGLVLHFYCC